MNRTLRHLLFIAFVLFFVATSAVILAYASGYRVTRRGDVVKTGILFVNGRPRDARVLINKKEVTQGLPYRAINLTPGSYHVRVEKEGYHPWEKTLNVHPRETTFATELTLWRVATPTPRGEPLARVERPYIPVPPAVITLLPRDASLTVLDEKDNRLLIRNSTDGGLFIVKPSYDTPPLKLPMSAVKKPHIAWNPDLKQWLVATGSELWLLGADGTATLVERTSVPIHTAQFLGDRPYILVHRGTVVQIMELDDRDQRNVVTLDTRTAPEPALARPGPAPARPVRDPVRDPRAVAVNDAATEISFVDDEGAWTVEIR